MAGGRMLKRTAWPQWSMTVAQLCSEAVLFPLEICQVGISQASGKNPRENVILSVRCHRMSLELPTGQWFQAYLKVHQGFVSEEENSRGAIAVAQQKLLGGVGRTLRLQANPEILEHWSPVSIRNELILPSNAARSYCQVLHYVALCLQQLITATGCFSM